MEIVPYLTNDSNVIVFLLLLLRFSGVFAFFPFFDNQMISPSIRGAMIFFMAVLFYPLAHYELGQLSVIDLMIAGLFELMMGFLAGLMLQIVFAMISFSGELMSFSMGLTMASAYDPISGSQRPIVGQLLSMLALLVALSLDFHHIVLQLIAHSLDSVPLGGFVSIGSVEYYIKALGNFFVVGFSMAFPILALLFGVVHNFLAVRVYRKYGRDAALVLVVVTMLLVVATVLVIFRLLGEG